MLSRLKTDFRLSIITLMGVSAVLGITPFAIMRFLQGNLVAGTVDVLIMLCIACGMAYAWITGDTRRCGVAMAIVICAGSVAAAVVGKVGYFWLYPCLMASFFLVRSSGAVIMNLITIAAAMLIQSDGFLSAQHMWSFFATAVMTSVCAYVFAFRNDYHRERLEQLAIIDPLTGVKNRRAMDEELNLAAFHAERTGLPYALVMLDIDHFKKVNDEYGHGVGDLVLIDLVTLVQQCTRKSDQLFRYGGEEFVLLLPGVDVTGLAAVMNNLQHILRKKVRHPGGGISASFGVALLKDGESVESWLERADSALYAAKQAGRDRVVFSDTVSAINTRLSVGDSGLAG